jgi:hypothetical protein
MPRAAISKGYASKIIPLDGLAQFLISHFASDRSSVEKNEAERTDRAEKNEKTPVSTPRV